MWDNPWSKYTAVSHNFMFFGPDANTNVGANSVNVMHAYAIDVKIDDAMPYTGRMITFREKASNNGYCVTTSLNNNGAHTLPYLLTNPTAGCVFYWSVDNFYFR